ncbi:protein kinase domain-containing protein [Paraburkholderia tropica]|uniref:protein kinase domain-containing protein n=1 Tax=Paraburkholderia tropica TaxID=92647 RepID=UPI003D29B97B
MNLVGRGESDSLQVMWHHRGRIYCKGFVDGDVQQVQGLFICDDGLATASSVGRLANEFSLRDELEPDFAAVPRALVRDRGRALLIVEAPDGEPLDALFPRRLSMRQFLLVAAGLCEALNKLHDRHIIHKDIKPGHVIANLETGRAWLTGFGIASRLPRQRSVPEPPEAIVGTLEYMAPEQTGRMNRSIDSRSDLYVRADGILSHRAD